MLPIMLCYWRVKLRLDMYDFLQVIVCGQWWYSKKWAQTEQTERIRWSRWNWRCTNKACSRQSCVTNGRRLVRALMETNVSLLTALRSSVQLFATHATRPRSAGWSSQALPVPMVTDAIFVTPLLSRRLWRSAGQSPPWTGEIYIPSNFSWISITKTCTVHAWEWQREAHDKK